MKLFVYLTLIICSHRYTVSHTRVPLWKRVKLVAVTRFDNIGSYYNEVYGTPMYRRQDDWTPSQPNKSTVRKLCKNIFKSEHFREKREHWIDANSRNVRVELKKDGNEGSIQTVFKKLERQASSLRFWNGNYTYEIGYRRRNVLVDGNEVTENLLVCLVKNKDLNQLKEYFVSGEYNVNSVDPPQPQIAGRFIFEYNQERRLVLHAMAEEPTLSDIKHTNFNEIEGAYLAIKCPSSEIGYLNTRYSSPEEDPVCQLTPSEKLRLCTTALTASKLRKKVKFVPSITNVQVDCEKRHISFRSTLWGNIAYQEDDPFQEQTIACETTSYDKDGQQIEYRISRGYDTNRIILFKVRDGKVLVKNIMTGASVVRS